MKNFIYYSRIAIALILLCWIFGYPALCCDRTDVTFVSYTPGPSTDTTLNIKLCIGGGVTGAAQGADGDTRSVAFGFYRTPNSPALAVVSFTPANMVGSYTTCSMPGSDIGPQSSPYNSRATIFYADPGYYMVPPCVSQPFQCVSTTANCGTIIKQCIDFTFRVNRIPDSMRVFGAESGGNPVAGCYPHADMLVIFPVLPVVWGALQAFQQNSAIRVEWTTLQEINTDFFELQRLSDVGYITVGGCKAIGSSTSTQKYSVSDESPRIGRNLYRVVQHDNDGSSESSQTIELNFVGPRGIYFEHVGPVPTRDLTKVSFFVPYDQRITVALTDIGGNIVRETSTEARKGGNSIILDMGDLLEGIYFLRLTGREGALMKKLIRI